MFSRVRGFSHFALIQNASREQAKKFSKQLGGFYASIFQYYCVPDEIEGYFTSMLLDLSSDNFQIYLCLCQCPNLQLFHLGRSVSVVGDRKIELQVLMCVVKGTLLCGVSMCACWNDPCCRRCRIVFWSRGLRVSIIFLGLWTGFIIYVDFFFLHILPSSSALAKTTVFKFH